MLAAERHAYILDQARRNGTVNVRDLAMHLAVSDMTIRRDLMEMEKRGLLRRTHGGATVFTAQMLDDIYSWETRSRVNMAAKVAIARAATELIREGDKLILHSGTTVATLARLLQGRGGLTVVTNSILVMEELFDAAHLDVLLTGGTLNRDLKQLTGPLALRSIESIQADKVFLSCSSVKPETGFSTSAMDEVILEQTAIRNARQAYLLVDHTKFHRTDFWIIGRLSLLTAVISDKDIDAEIVRAIEAQGVECILV